jgi:hypothetical protein
VFDAVLPPGLDVAVGGDIKAGPTQQRATGLRGVEEAVQVGPEELAISGTGPVGARAELAGRMGRRSAGPLVTPAWIS